MNQMSHRQHKSRFNLSNLHTFPSGVPLKMASGSFFDPFKLLHIAPVITSTGSLVYAISELIYNSAFVAPPLRKKSDKLLPYWYPILYKRNIWLVVGLNLVTSSTAIANILLNRQQNKPVLSTQLYCAGLAGAIGHMLFVPWVATLIENIVTRHSKEGAAKEMETWLSIHRVRILVADLPGWLSFLAAYMVI